MVGRKKKKFVFVSTVFVGKLDGKMRVLIKRDRMDGRPQTV